MFSLSILSAREVICPFKEWKQDSEVCRFGPLRAMITCTFRARDLKTKNRLQQHRVTAVLKIVNYDKIKSTFLDIAKNQPYDLM